MQAQMLAPAAVLVGWSLVVLAWLALTRFPAMARVGSDLSMGKRGGRGQDMGGVIPRRVNRKARNFTHLMEQPTFFCATALIIAMMVASGSDIVAP